MSDTPPYSEATVELVAAAIAAARDDDVFTEVRWNGPHWDGLRDTYRSDARASLDALAATGLLLPEGARTVPAAVGTLCCEHCGAMGHARTCPAVTKEPTDA